MNNCVKILNINRLNIGKIDEVLKFCDEKCFKNEGAFLIPLNPIKIIKARKKKDFHEIIKRADWVFPDAWGLKWAVSLLYRMKISLIPGYKLMFALIDQAERYGRSIYLLGTKEKILKVAINKLKDKYPTLKIVGFHNGFFQKSEEKEIYRNVADLKPDYVFVAMGEYRQEKIIDELMKVCPDAIFLGVGGSIDLVALKQPSPPEWVRRHNLEWLFRLIRQPFRLPRFKALPIFVMLVLIEKIKNIIQ